MIANLIKVTSINFHKASLCSFDSVEFYWGPKSHRSSFGSGLVSFSLFSARLRLPITGLKGKAGYDLTAICCVWVRVEH